jgi:GNAT superfamily N-acetyltransferase
VGQPRQGHIRHRRPQRGTHHPPFDRPGSLRSWSHHPSRLWYRLGVPNPTVLGDIDYVTPAGAPTTAAFGAELDGELVGSNFATRWGSVGLFGPLSVRPDLWDQDIGQRLMEPVIERFHAWGVQHAGLFTFAHSPKHMGLYQKYGFWPRFLTAVMSKPVAPGTRPGSWTRYAELPEREQAVCLRACRAVTESVYPGLDVERETARCTRRAGDTVLLWEIGNRRPGGLSLRPGTGRHGKCYIKFAVPPGPTAEARFVRPGRLRTGNAATWPIWKPGIWDARKRTRLRARSHGLSGVAASAQRACYHHPGLCDR